MFNQAELMCLLILTTINIISFLVMLNDKRRSMQSHTSERIPEGILFFLAAAFGSVGIYAGMFLLRHKTRKWYFILGIPILIAQNLAALYLLQEIFVR